MQTSVHPESGLSKATWTDQDLGAMSWELCQIHALAVTDYEGPPDDSTPEELLDWDDLDDTAPSALTLLFDLDYIVRRVESPLRLGATMYWVAPATLVFESVDSISGDLRSLCTPLKMRKLRRSGPAAPRETKGWDLECDNFNLRFSARDFTLHVRRPPRYGARVLWMADRGGISFEERSFA